MEASVKAVVKLVPTGDVPGVTVAAIAALVVHLTIETRILEIGRDLVARMGDVGAYRVLRMEKSEVSFPADTGSNERQ